MRMMTVSSGFTTTQALTSSGSVPGAACALSKGIRNPKVKAAADALAAKTELTDQDKQELARAVLGRGDLTKASRLRLAQTYLVA